MAWLWVPVIVLGGATLAVWALPWVALFVMLVLLGDHPVRELCATWRRRPGVRAPVRETANDRARFAPHDWNGW